VWSNAQVVSRVQIPQHYVCAMDVDTTSRSLYTCGVAKDSKLPPNLLYYPLTAGTVGGAAWQNPARISKGADTKHVTCIMARIKPIKPTKP
jgi:hypothetical protein